MICERESWRKLLNAFNEMHNLELFINVIECLYWVFLYDFFKKRQKNIYLKFSEQTAKNSFKVL